MKAGKLDVEKADMTDKVTMACWAANLAAEEEQKLGASAEIASPLVWAAGELLALLVCQCCSACFEQLALCKCSASTLQMLCICKYSANALHLLCKILCICSANALGIESQTPGWRAVCPTCVPAAHVMQRKQNYVDEDGYLAVICFDMDTELAQEYLHRCMPGPSPHRDRARFSDL
jgi:hypothetical protein